MEICGWKPYSSWTQGLNWALFTAKSWVPKLVIIATQLRTLCSKIAGTEMDRRGLNCARFLPPLCFCVGGMERILTRLPARPVRLICWLTDRGERSRELHVAAAAAAPMPAEELEPFRLAEGIKYC